MSWYSLCEVARRHSKSLRIGFLQIQSTNIARSADNDARIINTQMSICLERFIMTVLLHFRDASISVAKPTETKILSIKFYPYFTWISGQFLPYASTCERTHMVPRIRVPGGGVGCVRAWGLRNGIGTVVLTKIGRACALGEGWRIVRRPCRPPLERSILGLGVLVALSNAPSPRSCLTFPARRPIGDILAAFLDEILAAIPGRDRRAASRTEATVKVRGWRNDRDISSKRARRRYRGAAACRWKFYQYRGGHLVSLWQSLAKSYASNADRGLTPSRPIKDWADEDCRNRKSPRRSTTTSMWVHVIIRASLSAAFRAGIAEVRGSAEMSRD